MIFVMTDLEGVAGVVSFASQTYSGAPNMEKAKSLLTAEVNAAVSGLIEAGADEIVVMDGHGPGDEVTVPGESGERTCTVIEVGELPEEVRAWARAGTDPGERPA